MKAVLQRVSKASVTVDGEVVGAIGAGWLVLLGVGPSDGPATAAALADKTLTLRVFSDEQGKMNRSVLDAGGEILVVSQFTLYADCSRGRRPSFTDAAPPQVANELYLAYVEALRRGGARRVETGRFQAEMQVSLVNDGPVTILLELP